MFTWGTYICVRSSSSAKSSCGLHKCCPFFFGLVTFGAFGEKSYGGMYVLLGRVMSCVIRVNYSKSCGN